MAANLETALNALWDSGAGPGDRIVVIGAGMIGLLVTALAAGLPGVTVRTLSKNQGKGAAVLEGFKYAKKNEVAVSSKVRDYLQSLVEGK